MRDITIDSMVLQLPGLPEFEAKRLAMEIARKLGEEQSSSPQREIPVLRIEAPARAMENTSALANRIVAEILREIRRAP
jgi:hypothetical protein